MYCKKIEPSLHEYVETQGCQHNIVNMLFDNPPCQLGNIVSTSIPTHTILN